MTVSGKIGGGLGLLIFLLLAVHSYHVTRLRRLAEASRDLQAVQFEAALVAIEQLRLVDELEDSTQKLFVTLDPRYLAWEERLRGGFVKTLAKLRRLALSEGEAEAVRQLGQNWDLLPEPTLPSAEEAAPVVREGRRAEPPTLTERRGQLSRLREHVEGVLKANRGEVARKVERSRRASQEAQQISWWVALTAPVLTLAIGLWTIRSIRLPLSRLLYGTRAVAGGEREIQLEPGRDDEFAEVARAFNTMVHRLGELDRLKRDFLAQVSHDLKSPLAAMQETDKLLLEEIAGPLEPKQRRMIELHLVNARRLSAMISNLLDLARLEAGVVEYDRKTHDFNDLVHFVLAEVEPRLRERALALQVSLPEEPLLVSCDGDRILQVIENLVDNAIKFSPRGASLAVRLSHEPGLPEQLPEQLREEVAGDEAQSSALLEVADRGPGVPDDAKERIFEKFQQIESGGPRAKGGVGLGLAICREITQAHRGAVWVADLPGGGSIFYLLLPALAPVPSALIDRGA